MNKKRTYWIFLGIIILAFFAGNLSYPKYFNQAADFVNSKTHWGIPHFWNVPFKLGLDLQGGTHLVYQADLSNVAPADYGSAMQGLRDIIERRVNLFGVAEPVVQTEQGGGNYRLVVELAGIKDPAQAIQMIGETPFLEFKTERPQADSQKILDKQKELQDKTQAEAEKIADWQLALQDPYFISSKLTGQYLSKATLGFDPNTQKPLIQLQFNDEGSKLFEEITGANVGKKIAIYIDNELLSAPVVQEKITGGKAQITGTFTVKAAQDLVRNLNAGALPVPIKLISQESVGPSLGMISLEKSLTAGIYGFLAVIIFMIIFYRFPGILASLALTIYVVLVLALFKLIPVTLSLAGIAGFLLSIGMAVDANVLIFARMREERKLGKNFGVVVSEGFRRAWPSIRDSNLNTIIVSAILFGVATGFIKGFALTLILGVVVSLFSAIFITETFLKLFIGTKLEKIKFLW